jgi:peptidoglycan/xylan/chitin deacetylase (PgdA/CDA1 family)
MTKKISYCANHPDNVATNTCAHCSKPICYNCTLKVFGHTFCSGQCINAFVLKSLIRSLFRPFIGITRLSKRGFIEFLLVCGLIACLFFIWKLNRAVKSLQSEVKHFTPSWAVMDTARVLHPTVFQPAKGGMVYSNTLTVSGAAETDRIISLSIDGKLIRVLLPRNGTFVFDDVKLHRGNNKVEIRAISENGDVSTLQSLTLTYASATLSYLAADFRRGPLTRKQVALTFDGGSTNNAADEILDILKKKGVHSTFFLTGSFIRAYPETAKRIASEGHEVGNHTWTHPHLTSFAQNRKQSTLPKITSQKLKIEFDNTASAFQMVTGTEMVPLWRAPYGEYNNEILQWAAQDGYKHVGWTVGRGWDENMDTMDWVTDKNSTAYHTADEIVRKLVNHGKGKKNGSNGAIVLMHLGTDRKDDFPHKKLGEIIDGLRKMGYDLVKVTEMLEED